MMNYTEYSDNTCTTVKTAKSWRTGSCSATINRLVECDTKTANITYYAAASCTGAITDSYNYTVGSCNVASKKKSVQVVCIPAADFDETD